MLAACVTVGVGVVAGCDDDAVVEIGVIEQPPDPARIEVPATATRGEPFGVGLVTYGDGCVSFENTEINVTEDDAEITPYDRRTVGTSCTQILLQLPHDATLMFETTGPKLIRIRGRQRQGELVDEVVEKTFSLMVQ